MATSPDVDAPGYQWHHDLDHAAPPALTAAIGCGLSPHLDKVQVRLGIQRWPDGHQEHFEAELGQPLAMAMRKGGERLGEQILPPVPLTPLDLLRSRRGEHWSDPISDLDTPLWVYLARGGSRRLGIEYRLEIRVNVRWQVADAPEMTPKQILVDFGLSPEQYSLYRGDAKEPLPPDTPIHLHRGEHFEAMKDGKYGANA